MTRALGAATAALLTLAFLARTASADEESGVLGSRHTHYESPQHFAFEFRFAPYHPRIDSDPSLGGASPYRDTFGTMPRLEIAAEFDWQALRIPHLGTLGPGVSVGYTSMGATARLAQPDAKGNTVSGEQTGLDIFPMYAVLVLRADVVERELRIPLVPYVKGGVGVALWRAYNDGGTSSSATGTPGKGHTFGTQLAAGLALDLNAFDQKTARGFDNAMGVNHTYLFFEMMRSDLTGLFQSNVLFVGNYNWAMGLAFEF